MSYDPSHRKPPRHSGRRSHTITPEEAWPALEGDAYRGGGQDGAGAQGFDWSAGGHQSQPGSQDAFGGSSAHGHHGLQHGPPESFARASDSYAAAGYGRAAGGYGDTGNGYADTTSTGTAAWPGYGGTAGGYSRATDGYSTASNGYGATNGYGGTSSGYTSTTSGYGGTTSGYGGTTSGYGGTTSGYGGTVGTSAGNPDGYGGPADGSTGGWNGWAMGGNGYGGETDTFDGARPGYAAHTEGYAAHTEGYGEDAGYGGAGGYDAETAGYGTAGAGDEFGGAGGYLDGEGYDDPRSSGPMLTAPDAALDPDVWQAERSSEPARPGLVAGALTGFLAAAMAIGVATLAAAFVRPQASPVIAVGGAFIDRTPSWLKNFAVERFGENDKTMLLLGMYITIALIAMAIGIAARRATALGVAGIAAFGLFGAFVAITRPESRATDVVPSIVGGIAGVAALIWLAKAAAPAVALPRAYGGRRRSR